VVGENDLGRFQPVHEDRGEHGVVSVVWRRRRAGRSGRRAPAGLSPAYASASGIGGPTTRSP
jgi:hypothetical protein